MISRDHIGRTSAPITHEVTDEHIRRFADAVGDPDPVYRDAGVARAAGHARIPAPPTFAIALRPNDAREGLAIPWQKILHGEQELRYERPIYAGDVLTLTQRITNIYEKAGKSGINDFLVLETTARDDQGGVVFVARANIVVRR